jgi:hypothetical protein
LLRLQRHAVDLQGGIPDLYAMTPLVYFRAQMDIWPHYLRMVFWPWPQCLDYGWAPGGAPLRALLSGAFFFLLVAGSLWGLSRRSLWGFVGIWFLLTLGASSSFFPVPDLAFEHRLYLALAAPLVVAVAAGDYAIGYLTRAGGGFFERFRISLGLRILGMVMTIGILTAMTLARNRVYYSEIAMWQDVLRVRPGNFRAMAALSSSLLIAGRLDEAEQAAVGTLARVGDARRSYAPGYRLNPGVANYYECVAWNTLGIIGIHRGRYAEAVRCFREASSRGYAGKDNLERALILLSGEGVK